eukprot:582992-Hanusia_phi.AAC.3
MDCEQLALRKLLRAIPSEGLEGIFEVKKAEVTLNMIRSIKEMCARQKCILVRYIAIRALKTLPVVEKSILREAFRFFLLHFLPRSVCQSPCLCSVLNSSHSCSMCPICPLGGCAAHPLIIHVPHFLHSGINPTPSVTSIYRRLRGIRSTLPTHHAKVSISLPPESLISEPEASSPRWVARWHQRLSGGKSGRHAAVEGLRRALARSFLDLIVGPYALKALVAHMSSRYQLSATPWRRGASCFLQWLHFSCIMLAAREGQENRAIPISFKQLKPMNNHLKGNIASQGCHRLRGGSYQALAKPDEPMSEANMAVSDSIFIDVRENTSFTRNGLALVKASEYDNSIPGNETVSPTTQVRINIEATTYNLSCEGDLPIIRRMLLFGKKTPGRNGSTLMGSAEVDGQVISGGGRFKFLPGSAGSVLQGISFQYSFLHCIIVSKSGSPSSTELLSDGQE